MRVLDLTNNPINLNSRVSLTQELPREDRPNRLLHYVGNLLPGEETVLFWRYTGQSAMANIRVRNVQAEAFIFPFEEFQFCERGVSVPPFEGGQCPDGYRVKARVIERNSLTILEPESGGSGPLGPIGFYPANTGEPGNLSLGVPQQYNQTDGSFSSIITLDSRDGNDLVSPSITEIERLSGQPDDCGSLDPNVTYTCSRDLPRLAQQGLLDSPIITRPPTTNGAEGVARATGLLLEGEVIKMRLFSQATDPGGEFAVNIGLA